MPRSTRILLLLLAFAGLTGAAVADNWDRFRGPNGTGAVDDRDVPVTFGAKENILWKVPVPGVGNSSPVVWGKQLFLQSASKDGKDRTLYCIDTTNGKTIWHKSIPGTFVQIRHDSSLASATPAIDGEAVYIPFWDGKDIIMTAFDLKGEKLWSKNLGRFVSQHGAGASPIVYKDKLIFANDMDRLEEFKDKKKPKQPVDRPSILIALNKKTGEILWETPREAERTCYSAPFLLAQPGKNEPELVVVSTTAVTGYNLDSGSKIWEVKDWQGPNVEMALRTVASPALADGVLLATAGDGKGDRLGVGIALPGIGKIAAPQRLWENLKDFPYVPCPLSRGEHFYFVNDKGFAGCFSVRTGKRVWFERIDDTGFTASPLLIGGNIYATSEMGDVYVFAADPTFKMVARNILDERVRATPAVADGRLYVRGERNLFCIGKK